MAQKAMLIRGLAGKKARLIFSSMPTHPGMMQ
jgi:hypothetical protein